MARTADQGGVSTLTMMDHWFQMETLGGPPEPMLEGYTSLGFLAGQTSNLDLGLLVTGVTYRHPGLLAKIVTTLDVLSGGRAFLGIGAAWYEREHDGLGVPFPSTSERFERLEEALRICQQMWSDDDGAFEGKHYRLAETVCTPQPIQQPRPADPDRRQWRAQDAAPRRAVRRRLQPVRLRARRDEAQDRGARRPLRRRGPRPGRGARTALAGGDPFDDTDAFLRRMEAYAGLGIDQVWLMPPAEDPVGYVSRLCDEVLPRLGELG